MVKKKKEKKEEDNSTMNTLILYANSHMPKRRSTSNNSYSL